MSWILHEHGMICIATSSEIGNNHELFLPGLQSIYLLNICAFMHILHVHTPGGTDLERGLGMCGPEDPLFTPLLPLARVPFQAKESVHKTPFWENLEILASTASIFTQILAHKPTNLEIFSSQAPKFGNFQLPSSPFQRQMSVRKPHTSEIRAAHPEKKLSAPPGAHKSHE